MCKLTFLLYFLILFNFELGVILSPLQPIKDGGEGPKQPANSRRPGVLTSRSTLLNLLLVRLSTPPRSRLLQDRPLRLIVMVQCENINWLYTQTSVLQC